MSFLNKLKQGAKDITGIGLSSMEQYNRAYQKGIFLQPPDYDSAIENFTKAAEKFTKDGNTPMAQRASANAALYQLLTSADANLLPQSITALQPVPEIERFGSQQEMLPTGPLVVELTTLHQEYQSRTLPSPLERADAFRKLSDDLMKLGNAELHFATRLKCDGPTDRAMRRSMYYRGVSAWNRATAALDESPEQAQDYMHESLSLFKQAQEQNLESKVAESVKDVQMRRHCWMCDREVQGRNTYFRHYPSASSAKKYYCNVVTSLKHDEKMLEKAGHITLCSACGDAIEAQADAYATMRMEELKAWVTPILQQHQTQLETHAAAIARCQSDIARLERLAHSH